MSDAASITLTAAVLAGGRSTRMGRDKALLRVGARRWVDRQLALVRAVSPQEVLLSARRSVDYGCAGARVVHDAFPEAGPLAGIEAILSAASGSHVLVVAVDLPHLEKSLLEQLCANVAPAVGVVARSERGWEPLVAVYPREAVVAAREQLRARRFALCEWVEQLHELGLVRGWTVPRPMLGQLRNVNTPGDLTE